MSYQALARKWRPKRFAELMGQEHVVRALTHALATGRIHHAFLFTGTRGVGKTTIARIFAKSLNCEHGVSAEPCGACSVCQDVDSGRFLDLLEIDAASNTGVDDVREVIENAQYRPSRGQYKVYLIDEVHMLSKNAFNALLKTLEEPPEHAKFLLATTDPQKLPVTVLSRCLQFNLKRLSEEQIATQVRKILEAEEVPFDEGALAEVARAGNGSLRDALSVLDQAIAFGGGRLTEPEVRSMLGTLDHGQVQDLVRALLNQDAPAVLACVDRIAEWAPDFAAVLDAVAATLHRVQLSQFVPDYASTQADGPALQEWAAQLAPEELQLLYQMAVTGRRDMAIAPTPRIGFEMALLRLLAFRPQTLEAVEPSQRPRQASASVALASAPAPSAEVARRPAEVAAPIPAGTRPSPAATPVAAAKPPIAQPPCEPVAPTSGLFASTEPAHDRPLTLSDWQSMTGPLDLRGPLRELAQHAVPIALAGGKLRLGLTAAHDHLRSDALVRRLAEQLEPLLGPVRIAFETVQAGMPTAAAQAQKERDLRQERAETAVAQDGLVQEIIQRFDARIVPESTRPLD